MVNSARQAPATREEPWAVAVVSKKIREWIDRLGTVWVEGEITQWNARGGHVYGRIRDLKEDATLSFTIWASVARNLTEEFKQGDRVIALVKPDFWVKGGSLSVQVYQISHVGLGELLERLERLRKQLAAEGLFAVERKKPLPFLPGLIGLVTGRDSDAEKDVIRNATLRWPGVQFRVQHTAVQGDRAAGEVATAIQVLDQDPEVEVIIVARGGGDFLHLLPFSDEQVLRAAAAASTPIVSAIGHEADRPLLDEVADLRASTPTDAAKRVVPDVDEELAGVDQARSRLTLRLTQLFTLASERIAELRTRAVFSRPERIVDERAEELIRWVSRGNELVDRRVVEAEQRVVELRARLHGLSPVATLERGYAIAQTAEGDVLRAPEEAPSGTALTLRLAGGQITAESRGAKPSPE